MRTYSLSHLSDPVLLRDLATLVARDRHTTAELLAHLAEVDHRKLFLPAAYPSLFAYCVGELHLCEQAAFKRILAARTARRFPAVFDAVAAGRLHLSAVVLLAPHLREDTVDTLLAAATHKTKAEIEQLLAERFPRTEVLPWVAADPASSDTQPVAERAPQLSPGIVGEPHCPEPVRLPPAARPVGDRSKVKPLGPRSYAVQFSLSRSAHDKLRYAQDLLGHQGPAGDLAAVFERALDALIGQLEQQKFAATARPQSRPRPTTARRHIPAHVQRAVWERDHGHCTFVSQEGQRCPARTDLEFDHLHPVARGGEATVDNVRLLCRAHNQHAAEATFGSEFMRHKREAAREAADAHARAAEAAAIRDQARDVMAGLRELGFRADQARRAAKECESLPPDATLEQRLRYALKLLAPPHRRWEPATMTAT